MGAPEKEEDAAPPEEKKKKKKKNSKEVFFSVLPDRYEPLIEEEKEEKEEKEETRRRKKKKYKKYRKNVGKALRYSWSCLLLGLQNMASVYSAPLSAVCVVATEVRRKA